MNDKLTEIISNPDIFTYYIDTLNVIHFHKKNTIEGLSDREVVETESFYFKYFPEFTDKILKCLGVSLRVM